MAARIRLRSSWLARSRSPRAAMLFLRQRNIIAVGKIFNGIRERKVLMFSYKAEDIASGSAPEAVVELVFRIHLERRGLFLVERAKPDVPVARAAQMDRLPITSTISTACFTRVAIPEPVT